MDRLPNAEREEPAVIHELDAAALTRDVPDERLKAGYAGAVVLVYEGGAGYEVEFATFDGETIAVVTLLADTVRSVGPHEIAHARSVA